MWRAYSGVPAEALGEYPRISVHVRLINGFPVLFTERGEVVSGQRSITVEAPWEDVVSVTAKILVRRNDGES